MAHDLSRREFLKATAATAGVMAVGGLASSSVLGANDRITIGVVGVGNMGGGHLGHLMTRSEIYNTKVLAVSDVYQKRLNRAKDVCKGDGYIDYRRMLDRKDIDAVLIATPDHWHAKIATDAMESGKHVFLEKPMTLKVEQAIGLRDTVRKTGKVLQVGPQATSEDQYWKAHDAITAGRIGKVVWAQAGYNRNSKVCLFNSSEIDPKAGPSASGEDFVDWDMWLGHKWGLAPKISWNPEHFFRFRKYWPYNGGVATDLLYHRLAPLLLAITGPNGEYPRRVAASGGIYNFKDGRDIPDTFMMTIDYPSEFSIFLISTLNNDTQIPSRVYGKFGTMDLDGDLVLRFNSEFEAEFKAKNNGLSESKLEKGTRLDMKGNFIDVIRNGGSLNCNVELGAATMVAIKMGVESYRQDKVILWDAKKEKMIL
ncbi:MAG: Gfo/Idh/MocA family oxidoreductase [Armatimonadota bacterium]